MERLPEFGDGVVVPWGVEEVAGEVVELIPPNHAVVAVPVRGASGESLEMTHIRLSIGALRELPPWRIKASRRGKPSAGADAIEAWWFEAERDGESAVVEVRVSRTLSASSRATLPEETKRALATDGRSAFEKFSRRFRLPPVIVIGTAGVFELLGSAAPPKAPYDVGFEVSGHVYWLPERQAEILAENLRVFAAGGYLGDVGTVAQLGADPDWRAGARAVADVIEGALVGNLSAPIPLEGKAASAAYWALRLMVGIGLRPDPGGATGLRDALGVLVEEDSAARSN